MTCKEINDLLRNIIRDAIVENSTIQGIKHKIIRALVGQQGVAAMNKWLNNQGDKIYDFGVKPLSRIAESCGYKLHLVFVRENDTNNIENINALNYKYAEHLSQLIDEFVSSPDLIPERKEYSTTVNKVVNEILREQFGIEKE